MSEKRTISGVRTDLSPSEFSAKIASTTPKGQEKKSKAKKFFGNLGEVLSSLPDKDNHSIDCLAYCLDKAIYNRRNSAQKGA